MTQSSSRTAKKTFDCIEFKRQAQAAIYEVIKDMTLEERVRYFRHAAETGPFADLYRRSKQAQASDRDQPR